MELKMDFLEFFINIDFVQSKVIERLNPIIEPKEFDEVKYMNLQKMLRLINKSKFIKISILLVLMIVII